MNTAKITVRKVSHRVGLPFASFIKYCFEDGGSEQIGCFFGKTREEAKAYAQQYLVASGFYSGVAK